MMKRILCLFLSICTVIPVFLGFSFDIYAEDSYQYTFEEGLLTVTGSGMMGTETAALADYPWHSFRDSITEVVVGDGITAVGKNAFSTCPNLSRITFGRDVTSLGMDAFAYCGTVESVVFRAPLLEMGQSTVYQTTLRSVTLTDQSKEEFLAVASVCRYNTAYSGADFTILESEQTVFADLNGDKTRNVSDVAALLDGFGSGTAFDTDTADLDFDGAISISDTAALLDLLSGKETFQLKLNEEGNAYTVVGLGNISSKTPVLPSSYNGIPVTALERGVFRVNSGVTEITIPESISTVLAKALTSCDSLEEIHYSGTALQWLHTGAVVPSGCLVMVEEETDLFDTLNLEGATSIANTGGYGGGLRVKSTGELLFSPYLNELRALISAGKSYEDYEGYLRFTDLTTGYTYSGISAPPVKSKGQWVDFFLQGDGIDCGFCPTAGRSYSVEVAIVEKATGTAVVKGVCEMTAAEAFSSSKYYNPTALPSGSIRPGGKLWVNYLTSGGGSVSGAVNQFVKKGENAQTVTAVPQEGYLFLGWSDGVLTAQRTDSSLAADLTVKACFGPEAEKTGIANMFIYTETGEPVLSKEYVGTFVAIRDADSSTYNLSATARMKGRGNSSWNGTAAQTDYNSKNSYRLKFTEKQKLFGMGEKKNKDWVLQSNKFDLSGLRNWMVWNLANKMGSVPYVPECTWVQLYVNNEYRGMYMVCEQVEVATGRADVDDSLSVPDKGYLVEIDFRGDSDTDPYFYIDGYGGTGHERPEFCIKSDVTDEAADKAFIQEYIQRCHDAIMSGDRAAIEELVDLPSLVDMYILEELSKDVDAGRASFYLQKDVGGKLFFTAPWDFDFGFGTYGSAISNDGLISQGSQNCTWFASLITRGWFRTLVWERMAELDSSFNTMLAELDAKKTELGAAADKNAYFWNMYGRQYHGYVSAQVSTNLTTYTEHIDFLINWTTGRWSNLKKQLLNLG